MGQHFGISWLQVDDFRLSLQRSLASLQPESSIRTLDFFDIEKNPTLWQLPPESLCKAFVALGETMTASIEVVVENHVDTIAPAVIEGESILPSLFVLPSLQSRQAAGHVQAVFLVEPEEESIFANIVGRGRGMQHQSETALRTEAHAKWLYGQWLAEKAQHYGLPVLAPRPWPTLLERLLITCGT
jgi:2-phosphoglycerate kinase